jgi:DNA-binding protein H-NS
LPALWQARRGTGRHVSDWFIVRQGWVLPDIVLDFGPGVPPTRRGFRFSASGSIWCGALANKSKPKWLKTKRENLNWLYIIRIQLGGATKIRRLGMRSRQLSEKSLDQLWALHEEIIHLLSVKMAEEKARLDKRLSKLRARTAAPVLPAKRFYPPVRPKFRNPARPSETWAGRGKQPRWLATALKRGKRLEDFKIPA